MPIDGQIDRPGGYYQQRINGVSGSTLYLAARGAALLLGSTEQLSGPAWGAPGPFVYAGSLAPMVLSPAETAALERFGQAAARLGLQGLFGVDWIRNPQGLWLLELNPRYTAACELFDRLLEASLVAWHLSACSNGELPQRFAVQTAPQKLVAKAVVYTQANLQVPPSAPPALLAWRDQHGALAADIPQPGALFAAGQPLCTVFAAGDSHDGVLQTLRERAANALHACCTGYLPMQYSIS
jgi:predicted ATP-grasp superfamily ATP-dependent carboligase